jgi:hypothetical protein
VDRLDQRADLLRLEQTGRVHDADPIVGVEHGDDVVRPHLEPSRQRLAVACVDRVQRQRWQREVVHPIDLRRDFELIVIVPMDLDEHLDAECVRLRGHIGDERKRLRDHETAGARPLDREPDGVEPNRPYPGGMQSRKDRRQISPALRVLDVDVDLLAGERGPQD